jgi:hypothetical protein
MPVLVNPPTHEGNQGSYVWLHWFQQLHDYITDVGNLSWTVIDFTGSNITDIATRKHNDLQNIQGGAASDYNHLTTTQVSKIGNTRVVGLADGTSITPTADTADMNTHVNTQAVGALTVNAASGTPVNGQRLTLRIKSTNVQTFTWNAVYRGSTTRPLTAATTGASRTDYWDFIFNSTDVKWDLMNINLGFV